MCKCVFNIWFDGWQSVSHIFSLLKPPGDFKAHPKDLILAPCWLKGFKGNEIQRLIRKKKMVGDRMMAEDKHNMEKRIRFLYRRFNRTGKHR